jgi:phosphomannomutase/phosphoglucomutase
VNAYIFREYDIRGNADRDLTDDLVRAIGQAIAETVYGKPGAVVVGRDCRLHSPRLHTALTDGLRILANVTDIGIVPTPVAYFAQQHLKSAATVMITGSHNPAEDNGFKIMVGDEALHGRAITALGKRAADIVQLGFVASRVGEHRVVDVADAYIARAVAELRIGERRPKVVVDAGNGAGGPTAVALYSVLGFDVVPLYCSFDGSFPHHHPDPTQPENLRFLIEAVRDTGAELGIALDGDADRVGAVDATGRILWGDQLMVLFGRAIRDEVPDAKFVAEVKCSQAMYDALPSCEMWKVGHSLIKERMQQIGAQLAGEMSGHLFFAHRWLGFDDGIYAGARLLELLSKSDRTLADIAAKLPVAINTPEIRIDCPDDLKFDVVAKVTESLRHDPSVKDVVTIDGVRARFKDGWGLVRASNTQAALVMRCEAINDQRLAAIRDILDQHVAAARDGSTFNLRRKQAADTSF